MKLLRVLVGLVVAAKADYHEDVGIPMAARIKAFEDQVMAEVPDMKSRVVGGHVASVGAHPYLAGLIITLLEGRISICGSSLVSATRLVTAAHCLDRGNSMEAVLGSKFLHYGGIRMKTDVFTPHPDFNRSKHYGYDIGVVSLPSPVEFSALIQPVRLPLAPGEAEVLGEWGTAAGYGITSDSQKAVKVSSAVNEVRLKILPDNVCEEEYGPIPLPNTWVCTDGVGHVGTCGGDSGGPLVVERNGSKVLVGVTSFGDVECEINQPSVFTRVATYLDFIKQHL